MPDDLDELIAAYPWARSLPSDDQRRFAADLRQLITWRHTAEVHADLTFSPRSPRPLTTERVSGPARQ
jgi:hypothetical protein